jgi:hypothetical protein
MDTHFKDEDHPVFSFFANGVSSLTLLPARKHNLKKSTVRYKKVCYFTYVQIKILEGEGL